MLVILHPVHFLDWLDATAQAAPAFVLAQPAPVRASRERGQVFQRFNLGDMRVVTCSCSEHAASFVSMKSKNIDMTG